MGLRELLILALILAIVVVVLRGLFVALRSRRGKIKIALEKNVPEYDLDELEMRELPNGGARQVERSFAEVLRQNSAHAAKANATATGKPSTLHRGATGLKTNLSRTGARTAAVAATAQPHAQAAVKSEPVANKTPAASKAPELDLEPLDAPLFDEEPLMNVGDGNFDEETLSELEEDTTPADDVTDEEPVPEDPVIAEPALDEPVLEEPVLEEDRNTDNDPADEPGILEPVFSFAADDRDDAAEDYSDDASPDADPDYRPADNDSDDDFADDDEDDTDVFGEKIQRADATDAELDDVLDELLQTATPAEPLRPAVTQTDELSGPALTWEEMSEPEIEPDYEPHPEIGPEDEYQQAPTQTQQADAKSDPSPVEEDMPDFDNEYIADPEPQPEAHDSFAANRDDDMDVLFDDDDRERRIAALEEQQESAPKRFMSWIGGAFGRSGDSKADAAEAAEQLEKAGKANKKALKKQAKAERKQAQKELEEIEAAQNASDLTDDYSDDYSDDSGDDDGILSVRETERPGAAERARAEKLQQAQLDLDDNKVDDDDGYEQDEKERQQEPPAYSEVLVINVMARPGTEMFGDDLLPVLMSSGLKFGEMSIFHRHTDKIGGRKNGPVMFSVANALNPGTFDLNRISEFSTLGVCFFMTLPNVTNNMMAFEQMLATARKVQAGLDAELKDDNRSVMTAQTVEHYRQRIRDFELQELKNTRAR